MPRKIMKLFLISQTQDNSFVDTYDSAVVAAPDETTAQNMNPQNGKPMDWNKRDYLGRWCTGPEHVSVRYLGEAADGVEQGVVCASFNAG